jgi:arylsulfatase
LIDIMPTVLDWLDIPRDGLRLLGRSFAPLLRGESADGDLDERAIVSEAWHPTAAARRGAATIVPPTLAVRRGSHKLIRYKQPDGSARYELFDLDADPNEKRDLHAAGGEIAEELRALADGYEREAAILTGQMGLPPLRTDVPTIEDVAPEHLEALKALGYVE